MSSYLIVSDIHGSLPALQQALRLKDKLQLERLLLLGDLLNYGPRNGLPQGLDAMGVAELLNTQAGIVTAIRGNCDSEVDQMLLRFPIMADYAQVECGGKRLFLTHGHVYDENNWLREGSDVLCYGHTHLWKLEKCADGRIVCNTGSVTFPKGGNPPTLAFLKGGELSVMRLDGEVLKTLVL